MTEIRIGTRDDIEGALPLFRAFYEESIKQYFPYTEELLVKEMEQYADNKSSLVMIEDGKVVGLIAGKFVHFPMSNFKIYQETAWYVLPEHRKNGMKLFKENERYCKSIGIDSIVMGNMGNLNEEKMKRFYKSMGYQCMETQFVKRIS